MALASYWFPNFQILISLISPQIVNSYFLEHRSMCSACVFAEASGDSPLPTDKSPLLSASAICLHRLISHHSLLLCPPCFGHMSSFFVLFISMSVVFLFGRLLCLKIRLRYSVFLSLPLTHPLPSWVNTSPLWPLCNIYQSALKDNYLCSRPWPTGSIHLCVPSTQCRLACESTP